MHRQDNAFEQVQVCTCVPIRVGTSTWASVTSAYLEFTACECVLCIMYYVFSPGLCVCTHISDRCVQLIPVLKLT